MTYSGGMEGQVEILWRLRHDVWGQGYATEAARACIAHAAKLGIPELIAFAYVGNQRSLNVMKKLGMECVGEFDHPGLPGGPSPAETRPLLHPDRITQKSATPRVADFTFKGSIQLLINRVPDAR